MGFFDKIKESLTRTKEQFVGRFDEAARRADSPERAARPIDVDTVEALEEALISADVGVAATARIVERCAAAKSRGESLRAAGARGDSRHPARASTRPRRTASRRTW